MQNKLRQFLEENVLKIKGRPLETTFFELLRTIIVKIRLHY